MIENTGNLHSTPAIQSNDLELEQLDEFSSAPSSLESVFDQDNIALSLNEHSLDQYANEVMDGIESDKLSMDKYCREYKNAIKLAKMEKDRADKTFPFTGASKIMAPYLMDAAIDFNSRAMPEMLAREEIAKIQTAGKETDEKFDRAERISKAINYDLNTGIDYWKRITDKQILALPIIGTMFKKTWQCPVENKRRTELLYPDELIFDHTVSDFYRAPRHSHKYQMSRNDVVTYMRLELFVEMDLADYDDEDEEITFIESHCLLDLDEDGYAEPYIVTIEERGGKIASIVRRYSEEDITLNSDGEVARITGEMFFTQFIFIPDVDNTCMGLGYGILLSDTYEEINTGHRQMMDAGTLQNIAGSSGFYKQGTQTGNRASRARKGSYEMVMGQMTAIETGGTGPLTNDIMTLPFAGPSSALFQQIESIKQDLFKMTTTSYQVEANANEAASLYLARLQQNLKRPNALMIRLYDGFRKEFARIADLIRRYETDEWYENVLDEQASVAEDFEDDDLDVRPVANPALGSKVERQAQAQLVLDTVRAEQMPLFNKRDVYVDYFAAHDIPIEKIEKYLPPPQPNQPDPFAVAQMQQMQQIAKAEEMKGQASIMTAQTRLLEAQSKLMKVDAEIQKMESETLKNLSQVDKNERDSSLNALKAQREDLFRSVETQRQRLAEERLNNVEINTGRSDRSMADRETGGASLFGGGQGVAETPGN